MIKPIFPLEIKFSESEKGYIRQNLEEILSTGRLTLGEYTKKFEKLFSSISDTKYCVAVNSGTTALEIIFKIIDVRGKDVLVPANTNYATAIAVKNAGGTPVFYDGGVFPDTNSIKNEITSKTKVIVLVHIGGYITPEVFKIKEFCRKLDIYLVEDAAHAHGAEINGVKAGSIGHFGAFSFFPTKVVTTCEGGMISSSMTMIQQAIIYRDQGKDSSGIKNIVEGNSWRMSEIEAVFGIAQLKRFKKDLDYRRKILNIYKHELDGLPVTFFYEKNCSPSGYKAILILPTKEEKERLSDFLKSNFVYTGKGVYDIPLHEQPIFKKYYKHSLPISEHFSETHICLPIWRFMKKNQVLRVCNLIKDFYTN
ncbi:MAG: DegT/DnrJ/EryC1/StrS family aminotransferase [Candidatus Magasanikbacteria bacterium]